MLEKQGQIVGRTPKRRRDDAARYIKETHGVPCTAGTLAKLASVAERAAVLTPGGTHDDGLVARLVLRGVLSNTCDRLLAAVIYRAWSGGKRGFQFLPDPAKVDPDDYEHDACELIEALQAGAEDPRSVLIGDDRAFYDSLPPSFFVYRGCNVISAELAASGVCWTTCRDTAEWFAYRGKDPVVVRTKVHKSQVRLALAGEHEVVIQAGWHRPLKLRRNWTGRRHPPGWMPELVTEAA